MRKPRLTRAKLLGQDLPASKEQSWDSNPGPCGTTVFSYGSHLTLSEGWDPLGSRGERGLSRGTSGQLCLWPGEVTQQGRVYPSPCPRHLWNLPARPQQVPTPSCQAGIYRERMYRQADSAEEAPHPHNTSSIPDLPYDRPAPTFPGPSALGAGTRATSPKSHGQASPEPSTTHSARSICPSWRSLLTA